MMFLVGGPVGNTDHQPGDNGGDQVYRAVQRLGDQGQAADSNSDHELGGSRPGARKDGNRCYRGFLVMNVVAHGCGFSSPAINIKAPIGSAIPPAVVRTNPSERESEAVNYGRVTACLNESSCTPERIN